MKIRYFRVAASAILKSSVFQSFKKSTKIIIYLLIVLSITLFSAELYKIFGSLSSISLPKVSLNLGFIFTAILITVLLPLNWGLESLKWQIALKKILPITFIDAARSVVAGTATGVITPNRVGEFAGRVMLLPDEHRKNAIGVNFVCSFSQLWATVFFGSLAVGIYSDILQPGTTHQIAYGLISFTGFILLFALGIFIFKIRWLSAWVIKRGLSNKIEGFFTALAELPQRSIMMIMLLSLMRYAVFLAQQLLALQLLGMSGIPYFHAAAIIAMVYFFATILPVNNLLELGIRSAATLHLWNMAYPDAAFIALGASLLIWLINMGIPVLAGNYFLFKHSNALK